MSIRRETDGKTFIERVSTKRVREPLRPETEVHGSQSWTKSERWERSRTLCLPDLCMYRYACPVAGQRDRYVRSRDCYRQRPRSERPPASLSDFAIRLLESYR